MASGDVVFNAVLENITRDSVKNAITKYTLSNVLPDGSLARGMFEWKAGSISMVHSIRSFYVFHSFSHIGNVAV
jgi:hypothetical protein